MKIAVMTWFHYDNYGTVLQAAALCKILRSFGHEADVIDYFPARRCLTLPQGGRSRQLMRRVRRIRTNNEKVKDPVITTQVSGEAFARFRSDQLTLTPYCETLTDLQRLNEMYDAFVCGSDRIWLPMNYDPRFYLDFVGDPQRMIAYAPSILDTGETDPYVLRNMQQLIGRFVHLSVREEAGRHYLGDAFGKKTQELADPLLLVDPMEWGSHLQLPGDEEEHYLLAVFQGDQSSYRDAAVKLAARLELKLQFLPIRSGDMNREGALEGPIGPVDYISLIRNADYICTDSYHATLLCLLFQKQFCCFERFTRREELPLNARVHHILASVGLMDRLYVVDAPLEGYLKEIDYIPVNYKLDALRITSRDFLSQALEAVAAHVDGQKQVARHVLQGYDLCSGCGACAAACEQNAISIVRGSDGFLRAQVQEDLCSRCQRCRSVCPFQGEATGMPLAEGRLLSYQDEEPLMRADASAGALCGRLARVMHDLGWAVAGCTFQEEEQRALHRVVEPLEDGSKLDCFKGTKYMQSDFSEGLQELMGFQGSILIFGTPCQIEGARRIFWDRTDVYYAEISCNGMPSYLLFEKYKKSFKGRNRMNADTFALAPNYRQVPGHGRFVRVSDGTSEKIIPRRKDAFSRLMDSGICYAPACYECRWRSRSSADLRIGDFRKGMSGNEESEESVCICMTDRGKQMLDQLMIAGYWEGLHKQDISAYLAETSGVNPPIPVFMEELAEKIQDEKTGLNRMISDYVRPLERH